MNNTANGGRKCYQYTKDGTAHYIRFVIVNNSRTLTTYANVWDGENRIAQTCEVPYKNKAMATLNAEKILANNGYIKA